MSAIHRIGDVSVTKVVEQCGPGFAPDYLYPDWDPAVLEQHRGLMIPDCFDEAQGRFVASIHSWVVRTQHHTILVDSCTGNDKDRPGFARFDHLNLPYLERLAEAGVQPEAVDFVLCTHLHIDHCGWNTRLIDGRWVPTFPNAKYVFSREEYQHWSGPAGNKGFNPNVYADSVLPVVEANQAMIVESDATVGDGLLLRPTPGHSPGHVCVCLQSGGQEGLFCADTMHQPLQVYRPDWNDAFCTDPAAALRSRRGMLEHAAERQATVFTGHFARSSAGHVTRTGDGFEWRFA